MKHSAETERKLANGTSAAFALSAAKTFVFCRFRFARGLVPVKPTMYSMSLAAGTTDERARLCSLTHSSMKASLEISGSPSGEAKDFAITQAHRSVLAVLAMLASGYQDAN